MPAGGKVLADDPQSKAPLMIAGSAGSGHYLLSALPLEPPEGRPLYLYQPFLLEGITQTGSLMPALAGSNLGVYVNFGYHNDEQPEALAARLKLWGFSRVSFSAWYDNDEYRTFLHSFLPAAHRQGLQVDAWLELPMVSIPFWKQHPEWRQRTASGRAAQVDWQYLMALENPACLKAVEAYVSQIIDDHDWDGINLAEVYYESPGLGYKGVNDFTPMTDQVRQQFSRRYGVDPCELFNPKSAHFWQQDQRLRKAMDDYRVQLVTRLHRQLLDMCMRCKARRPDLHLTVTQIDTLLVPSMREQIGVDIAQLLALQKRYPFDLQLEDPYPLWNLGPDRYRVIGEMYRRRLPAGAPLAIDINVVDRDPDPGEILVTVRQHGLELYGLVAACAEHADCVYLYTAYSLETPDMRLAPYAAANARLTPLPDGQLRYTSARQVYWTVDTRQHAAYLDNQPWPCLSDDRVLLPAGTHTISLRPLPATAAPTLRLEALNAELLSASRQPAGCAFSYRSQGRCYVTLNAPAKTIRIDGKRWPGKPLDGAPHALYVLPSGEHAVMLDN